MPGDGNGRCRRADGGGTRRRLFAFALLAVCLAAACLFRSFVFVAYYPVVMSLAAAAAFGASLFDTPVCLAVARRLSPRLLPPGGERYARRLTVVWFALLLLNAAVAFATVFAPRAWWVAWNGCASYLVLGGFAACEGLYRRRRFSVSFSTSGSTSAPKAVRKRFDALLREVTHHVDRLSHGAGEGGSSPLADPARVTVLATVEAGHMYGYLWKRMLPQVAGCSADPETILEPEVLIARMRAASRVMLVTTPSFIARLGAYADQYDIPQNAVEVVTSGALLKPEVAATAKRLFGVTPLEIFGSTETGGVAWRRQTVPDADWTVFDPVRIAADGAGRLVVRSPFSFRRTFTMGDGVAIRADGRSFRLLGRLDRIVKINEVRLSLPDLEAAVAALPGIREAALVTLPSPHGDRLGLVVAVADAAARTPADARALRAQAVRIFPSGTAPKRYRFVEALPRNPQGKVTSSALAGLFVVK